MVNVAYNRETIFLNILWHFQITANHKQKDEDIFLPAYVKVEQIPDVLNTYFLYIRHFAFSVIYER